MFHVGVWTHNMAVAPAGREHSFQGVLQASDRPSLNCAEATRAQSQGCLAGFGPLSIYGAEASRAQFRKRFAGF